MLCMVKTAALWGLEPYIVRIETDISSGMPYFNMVGLLASEVKEARERVRVALKNSGETLPMSRITVNMSPADRRKEGVGFDLPIAVSLLCSMGRIDENKIKDILFVGELGLDGKLRYVKGAIPIILMAKKLGFKKCVLPVDNIRECVGIEGVDCISFASLREIVSYFNNEDIKVITNEDNEIMETDKATESFELKDFKDVYGQEIVKKAFMIAAAGWHHILLVGSPGIGKSMMAMRMGSIMPDMTEEEKLQVMIIKSVCGELQDGKRNIKRPFSAPHHTITGPALIGGGLYPVPGQITYAHKGVLFLDELPEFNEKVIDLLRQPMEERVVKIHRMNGNYVFPADCLIIAAMNPCRCGYYPDRSKCNCSEVDVQRYGSKISGPIRDRIDICLRMDKVLVDSCDTENNMSSEYMKQKVVNAVEFAKKRQGNLRNGQMKVSEINKYCVMDEEAKKLLKNAYVVMDMNMRTYYKIIKISRTIADLEEKQVIEKKHIAEAMSYRNG